MKFLPIKWLILSILLIPACLQNLNDLDEGAPLWKIYTKSNTSGDLVNDNINDIHIDAGNKKWIATDEGVSVLGRAGWGKYTKQLEWVEPRFGQVYRKVNSITDDPDGNIWFGLSGGGIKRFAPTGLGQTWISYNSTQSLSSDVITAIDCDRFGNIWCATTFGISHYKPKESDRLEGTWYNYNSSNSSIPSNFLWTVKVHHGRNIIFFGTEYGEVVSFDGVREWRTIVTPIRNLRVNSIGFENPDYLWIGTEGGLFRYSTNTGWKLYTNNSTSGLLPSNSINAIVVDAQGNKWIGTNSGITRMKDDSWITFNRNNSPLPSDSITTLAIDLRGNIWIGTPFGLAVYNEKGIK